MLAFKFMKWGLITAILGAAGATQVTAQSPDYWTWYQSQVNPVFEQYSEPNDPNLYAGQTVYFYGPYYPFNAFGQPGGYANGFRTYSNANSRFHPTPYWSWPRHR